MESVSDFPNDCFVFVLGCKQYKNKTRLFYNMLSVNEKMDIARLNMTTQTPEDLFRSIKFSEMPSIGDTFAYYGPLGRIEGRSPLPSTVASFEDGAVTITEQKAMKNHVKIGSYTFTDDGLAERSFKNGNPNGLSVRNYNFAHGNSVKDFMKCDGHTVTDLPDENNLVERNAYHIMCDDVANSNVSRAYTHHEKPKRGKKTHNSGNNKKVNKWNINTFFCYCLKKDSKLFDNLELCVDNDPPGHRTILPKLNETVHCWIGNDPQGNQVSCASVLYRNRQFSFHCMKMVAMAEPVPFEDGYDHYAWNFAMIVYSYFNYIGSMYVDSAYIAQEQLRKYEYPELKMIDKKYIELFVDLVCHIKEDAECDDFATLLDYEQYFTDLLNYQDNSFKVCL